MTAEEVIGPVVDNNAKYSDKEMIYIDLKTPTELDTPEVSCQIIVVGIFWTITKLILLLIKKNS